MENIRKFVVGEEEEELRLDVFLSEQLTDLSRTYIQRLIKDDMVQVNQKREKASYRLMTGDEVHILIPPPANLEVEMENLPLDIFYEDEDIAVVYKPRGMVVHPAPGNYTGTLVNAIMYHMKGKLSSINGIIRPGIVHRIDKDTSGLLMIAKTDLAHRKLSEQLKNHSIRREYTFICYGRLPLEAFTIEGSIGRNPKDRLKMAVVMGGKEAITHVKALALAEKFSYGKAVLETGRTHQIRVHLASKGHPLLGDLLYGPGKPSIKIQGQLLHAGLLGLIHPVTEEYMEFTAPEPEIFIQTKKNLGLS